MLSPARPPSGLSFKEAQPICSDNSGNLMWALAAQRLLDPNASELVQLAPPYDAPIQALLLPEANMLVNVSKRHTLGLTNRYRSLFKNLTAPIMLIGVGSQVRFEEAAPGAVGGGGEQGGALPPLSAGADRVRLGPEQKDFLRMIAKSEGMVTVRGEFTASLVAANGLHRPLPLGCPTFFLNHNPRLGEALQQKWDALVAARDPKLRLAVYLPNIPGDKPYPESLLKLLAERVFKPFPNSVAVLQTPHDENTLENMHRLNGLYLRSWRVRYFYDAQSWIDGLAGCCDFVLGFRIHGAMAGVAAEVPGLLLSPDMRVRELAAAMRLPSLDMLELHTLEMGGGAPPLDPDHFDLFDFLATVKHGYAGFDERRREVGPHLAGACAAVSDVGGLAFWVCLTAPMPAHALHVPVGCRWRLCLWMLCFCWSLAPASSFLELAVADAACACRCLPISCRLLKYMQASSSGWACRCTRALRPSHSRAPGCDARAFLGRIWRPFSSSQHPHALC
jgi:hypothetical protein